MGLGLCLSNTQRGKNEGWVEVGAPPPYSERQQLLHCSECTLGAKTLGGGLGNRMEQSPAFSPVTLTEGTVWAASQRRETHCLSSHPKGHAWRVRKEEVVIGGCSEQRNEQPQGSG